VNFGSTCPGGSASGIGYQYTYGYNPAGRVTYQNMQVNVAAYNTNYGCNTPYTVDQVATYGWDTEGRMTSLNYPGNTNELTYTYDAMAHQNGMSDSVTGYSASATYGTAGEMDSLSYAGYPNYGRVNETLTYNSMWQLTGMSANTGATTVMSVQYGYTAGHNNGRISNSVDGVLGQTVNYTYDSLNRLATAQATNGAWGQSYSYDGFGNLTAKTVTAGTAINFSASYNAANNQQSGLYYDANGNLTNNNSGNYTYDVENRMTYNSATYIGYGYDPMGKRVVVETPNQSGTNMQFMFYGVMGQRLSTFTVSNGNGVCLNNAPYCTTGPYGGYLYLAGKLIIQSNGQSVVTDRLGSQRSGLAYYPWGEDKPSSQPSSGQVAFATYWRDMPGQDYADQRYYNSNAGRFWTPDPENGGRLANPISLNLYNYALGDPINLNDPTGLAASPSCGQTSMIDIYYGAGNLGTLSSLINGTTNLGILAEAIFAESSSNGANTDEKFAIADVILNRFMIVNGYDNVIVNGAVWGAAGPGREGFGWANGSIAGIVGYPNQFGPFQTTTATQTSAALVNGTNLTTALNSGAGTPTCTNLENDFWSGYIAYTQMQLSNFQLFGDATFVPTSFNSFKNPGPSLIFEENTPVNFGTANQFYGISPDMVQYNDGFQDPAYSPPPRPTPRPPGVPRRPPR
jgi:RHS repeat-associated protein